MNSTLDLAQIRFQNALALFEEFVHNTVKHPDAATLRGLEGRFALRVQIQPSYWSQIKSRSRQIGERLARQFEHLCHKPHGWMDQVHDVQLDKEDTDGHLPTRDIDSPGPQDDDERFIVGLVLTYYRRHPQRARTRLLDLLGEALTPAPASTRSATSTQANTPKTPSAADETFALWRKTQAGVAPLKQKK